MEKALQMLLNNFQTAEAAGAPLNDSVLREALWSVIREGLFEQKPDYKVPKNLLLHYSPRAAAQNNHVVMTMERFLKEAKAELEANGITTAEEREMAFMNSEVFSSTGEVNVASYFD